MPLSHRTAKTPDLSQTDSTCEGWADEVQPSLHDLAISPTHSIHPPVSKLAGLSILPRLLYQSLDGQSKIGRATGRELHAIICVCDHWEPGNGGVAPAQADARVDAWCSRYPTMFSAFRDSDGKPPRHTFFYPIEMYRPVEVERIAALCSAGFGEVEVHLHHDNDTAENLRATLLNWKHLLRTQYRLLSTERQSEDVRYAFIHGNWSLDNSRPDGRFCGVNNELDVLRETGCYADFTMPAYPSPCQSRKTNSIYYAVEDPKRPRSHDTGTDVGAAPQPSGSLMLIQGPLLLNWKSRKWGVVPRVENANLQANQPPSDTRLDLWLRAGIQVPSRPDWFFIKLHTHGATEANQAVVLGEPMVRFHQALAARAATDRNFHFHYVTAREMYNLVKAAEGGWQGSVADARDYQLVR